MTTNIVPIIHRAKNTYVGFQKRLLTVSNERLGIIVRFSSNIVRVLCSFEREADHISTDIHFFADVANT